MRLTEVSIRNFPTPEHGQKAYFDATVTGFHVRVSQGGVKSYCCLIGPQRRRVTIARVGYCTLAEARQRARELISEAVLGKHRPPPSVTFPDALDRFLQAHRIESSANHAAEMERLLRKHFLPGLRSHRMEDIQHHQIAAVIDSLIDRGTLSMARHAGIAIRGFFRWAKNRHLIATNPCESLQTPSPESRTRLLADHEAAKILRTARTMGYPFGTMVEMLAFSLQRREQIGTLRFSWIGEDTITWPGEYVKSGTPQTLPLTPHLASLIDSVPRLGDLLFPARGTTDKPCSGWSKWSRALQQRSGIPDATLHDWRRYGATYLAATTPPHLIERLLGHTTQSGMSEVHLIYNRYHFLPELRETLARLEAHLLGLLAR